MGVRGWFFCESAESRCGMDGIHCANAGYCKFSSGASKGNAGLSVGFPTREFQPTPSGTASRSRLPAPLLPAGFSLSEHSDHLLRYFLHTHVRHINATPAVLFHDLVCFSQLSGDGSSLQVRIGHWETDGLCAH